ncbi:MAG: hypothetical protein K2I03_12305 [Lachnospiraceae bacterium]|nr:hypothetical protein [Lachnospiraceae bacterium]
MFRKILFTTILFIVLTTVQTVSADAAENGIMTSGELPPANDTESGVKVYDNTYVDAALASEDELEILKAILLCIRDIDIIIQYIMIIVFGGLIVYFTVIYPLMQFLK